MSNLDFLGVTINTENGSSNAKIRKALDKSFQLLNIIEFVKITKFKLNMVMFDYFWQVVVGNTTSHLTSSILEYKKLNFIVVKNTTIKYITMTTTKVGFIYAIENNFDASTYIGLTTKSVKERYAQHLQAAKSKHASCILHKFMAKYGPENFTVRELRRVEYNSIIELQLVEEECIRDFGDLNTVYNSRSYEMAGITLDKVVRERKPPKDKVILPPLPSKEEIIEIACEAEEIPNKKIPIDHFISLFIEEDRNYGKIIEDMTSENGYIHICRLVLQWFGYTGEIKEQKKAFLKMLKRNNILFNELTQYDKQTEIYPTIQEELRLIPSNVKHTKFIIMEPDDLKMAIMQLKTKNGHIIRQYYIDLEKLLKMYTEYTLYFNHRESQRKITNLEQMMADMKLERKKDRQYLRSLGITLEEVKDQNEELLDKNNELLDDNKKVKRKLGIAVEDRAPLPQDESKRERFVLIKRNDPEYYLYYTIRAQEGYTQRKLKTEKLHFPNLEVLLDFKCNPNSKSLYTRIKENLKTEGVTFKGNNIDLENSLITEEDLIEKMKVTSDARRKINF
ncbi:hypothetical protein IIV22A_093R [Invertebrate iridescent virus 22]|uniref:GIY-YIG domain-containing protein n=1 Tax=Invertebrate iridescent virus 22 TaxID=345198 RepID=W8W1C9_9VIRU|nr:hypothetical protein IIV22A_093R [Invertebrate iridescent virus 22]CCV01937.1 hypothetical protein IIV22A_093R [Invertebrate iridescent virus 22]